MAEKDADQSDQVGELFEKKYNSSEYSGPLMNKEDT